MDRLGKERNPYRAGFLQSVGVAESREEAMRLYREPAEYFYGRCLRVDPRWAMPPGYITEATQRAGIVGQIGRAASLQARQAARATTQMEDIVERGYVIIGSPEEVVEQLTEVATDLNVGHLMLLMQFGSMGKDLAAYNTKLFADQGIAESCAACSANGKTNGGRSQWRGSSGPRRRPLRRRMARRSNVGSRLTCHKPTGEKCNEARHHTPADSRRVRRRSLLTVPVVQAAGVLTLTSPAIQDCDGAGRLDSFRGEYIS